MWWVASGREMNLRKLWSYNADAIGMAKNRGMKEVVTLLERFKENPLETRHAVRVDLRWYSQAAAMVFALVIFVSDELLAIRQTTTPATRFFRITSRLPLELQMVLCNRVVGLAKEIIPRRACEAAFKALAIQVYPVTCKVKKDEPKEVSLTDRFNGYKKALEFVFRQGVTAPVGFYFPSSHQKKNDAKCFYYYYYLLLSLGL